MALHNMERCSTFTKTAEWTNLQTGMPTFRLPAWSEKCFSPTSGFTQILSEHAHMKVKKNSKPFHLFCIIKNTFKYIHNKLIPKR